ncbi:MAG: ubiE [Gammaproteobacteria bacterium]|jgi:demethylmenaquinone methyltransferase/2-methoxy-6-polyprenyl-1,4-benzoquinol methylase|nr:ubiE [Gammaproteobacteria bacterium]
MVENKLWISLMSEQPLSPTIDFGYQQIPTQQKVAKVAEVFRSVADKYDLMNDLMSLGIHRLWKRFAIALTNAHRGQHILDLAGGTGDLAKQLAKRVGEKGMVYLADINEHMLGVGRDRLIDKGIFTNVRYIQANAECLPFAASTFDRITIAFGLRNVTDKAKALRAMYQVLKPGGQVIILEFSKPVLPLLQQIYDAYSFNLLPKLGQLVTNDAQSYQYLVESIRMHPSQENLKTMILAAGFDECEYFNLNGGIVALHRAYKY